MNPPAQQLGADPHARGGAASASNPVGRHRLATTLSAVFFCACTVFAISRWLAPAPLAACPQPVFDFGVRTVGVFVEHDFPITNRGPVPLRLIDAKPSCGCTTATIAAPIVHPQSQSLVHVTVKVDLLGPQKREVIVRTSDAAHRFVRLHVTGIGVADQPPVSTGSGST